MHMKDSRNIERELDDALATNAHLLDEIEKMKEALNSVCSSLIKLQIDTGDRADLRDQFAIVALPAVMNKWGHLSITRASEIAYDYADAMLEARE